MENINLYQDTDNVFHVSKTLNACQDPLLKECQQFPWAAEVETTPATRYMQNERDIVVEDVPKHSDFFQDYGHCTYPDVEALSYEQIFVDENDFGIFSEQKQDDAFFQQFLVCPDNIKNDQKLEQDSKNVSKLECKTQRKRINKEKRWGKDEDIRLFRGLKTLCQEEGEDITQFATKDYSQPQRMFLLKLRPIVQWKGTATQLFNRIRTLMKSPKMSVRDMKKLRKLSKAHADSNTRDLEQILEHFPGKDEETIKETYYAILDKAASRRS